MINKAGTYRARAREVLLITSKNKGTPGVQVNFGIVAGEFEGQTIRWDGWFTEQTTDRAIESLEHCGWRGDDLGDFAGGKLSGLDKNEVEVVVEMEEYQGEDEKYIGKEFPRVQWVNRIGGRPLNIAQAMSPEVASAFGDKMKAAIIAARQRRNAGQNNSSDSFPHGANVKEKAAAQGKRF